MHRAGEKRLVFHWPDWADTSLALPAWILLAVLAHGAMFGLFRIVYPPLRPLNRPPAEVVVISGENADGADILAWLSARDPRRLARAAEVLPSGILEPPYTASFSGAALEPAPPVYAEDSEPLPLPRVLEPAVAVRSALAVRPPSSVQEPVGGLTSLTFSPALAVRSIVSNPGLRLQRPATVILKPSRFMVALNGSGEIEKAFLVSSSGDAAIDRQAEDHLGQIRFDRAGGGALIWGTAVFDWGAEAYRPQP